MGTGVSLTLLPTLETLFILLDCFVQPHYEGFQLVLLYLVFFLFFYFFLFGCLHLNICTFLGKEGGVERNSKEWREGKLAEMCCTRKQSIFNFKKDGNM